ncbi:protein of unknown function [Amycolatopsis marina]|uniref:DUF4383 domain-containing protein n=1 Tax=Amycolatopsis marina TaxID=490629 RepID=A0A1I0XYU1_9PSEU|nr:DUF4383 domain-containing protein [Amycolatopsis marina]SFB06074.1 protein of unknown function [Amycolatopsis marina]
MSSPSRGPLLPRLIALVIGLVYLTLGLLGFFVAEPTHMGHDPGNAVWIFSTSALLNIVHTAVGALGIAAATKTAGAQFYGWALFVGFTGFTIYGVFAAAAGSPGDHVNIDWANNWLHGGTAVLGLVLGFLQPKKQPADAREARTGHAE